MCIWCSIVFVFCRLTLSLDRGQASFSCMSMRHVLFVFNEHVDDKALRWTQVCPKAFYDGPKIASTWPKLAPRWTQVSRQSPSSDAWNLSTNIIWWGVYHQSRLTPINIFALLTCLICVLARQVSSGSDSCISIINVNLMFDPICVLSTCILARQE